jgi:hypothetical protein
VDGLEREAAPEQRHAPHSNALSNHLVGIERAKAVRTDLRFSLLVHPLAAGRLRRRRQRIGTGHHGTACWHHGGGAAVCVLQRDGLGTPIAGATSATLTMTSALAADHGARFSAVVNNSAGSVTSAEAVLTEELPMFLLAGQSNTEGNVDTALFQMFLADLASAANTDTKARLAERIRSERSGRFAAVRLIALNQMRQRVRPRTGVWSGLEPGRVLGHIADQGRSRRNESLR